LQSSRAYVSDPPTTPGTSVSSEIPTTGRVKQASATDLPPTVVAELVTFHTQSLRLGVKRLWSDSSTGVLAGVRHGMS